jgi:hypothetical protein
MEEYSASERKPLALYPGSILQRADVLNAFFTAAQNRVSERYGRRG